MREQKPTKTATDQWIKVVKGFAKNYSYGLLFILLFAVVGTYALTKSSASSGPDLVVTNVSMSPSSPAAGQAVTFSATIENQGTDAVSAGTVLGVAFSVDGQKVSWNETNTAGLAVGSSVTLTANAGSPATTWTATTGPHTLVATADDTNVISELNEGNNTLALAFTVGNTGNLYVSPATSSVLINNNVTVTIHLLPGTTVDGVEATLSYDQTKLQFVSVDTSASPFNEPLVAATGGSGTVTFTSGNLSGGVSSDSAPLATVVFKALVGSGSTTLQMAGNATKSGVYTNPTTTNGTVNFSAPDTTPPVATVTAPAAGATILTTQTLTATATDNVGVTKIELYVDGQLVASGTSSPLNYALDTTTLANGTHTIVAKAYDAAGNVGTSSTVTVTVKNWPEDINQDGKVDLLDFSLLASKFGQTGTNLGRADINGDGKVNLLDFSLLASKFGQ